MLGDQVFKAGGRVLAALVGVYDEPGRGPASARRRASLSRSSGTDRVRQAVAEWHLPAVLVHPTFLLGPGDAKPTSNALLLELCRGQLPGCPAGGKNCVRVADAAAATVNALARGRVGESYILGHEKLGYREAFGLMATVMGVRAPRGPVPPALARLDGAACDWRARRTGRPALLNSGMVAVANDGHHFSAHKAVAELALPQTPVRQAIQDGTGSSTDIASTQQHRRWPAATEGLHRGRCEAGRAGRR